MTTMYEKFENLKNERGLKFSEIQRATGIPYSTFTDWKAGRYIPKIDKIKKIADYFDVSLEYFTDWKEERSITDFEYEMILKYRELSAGRKACILELMHIPIYRLIEGGL